MSTIISSKNKITVSQYLHFTYSGNDSDSEDTPMTVSQFKKMLAEERQTDSDARFALLEKETISEVKQKYTAETQGEGLDFDSASKITVNSLF